MSELAQEFRKTPFLKLVIPFIAGIIYQLTFPLNWQTNRFLLSSTFVIFLVISLTHLPTNYRLNILWGLALYLFMFAMGLFITADRMNITRIQENILKADASVLEITDLPMYTPKSIKSSAKVIAFRYENTWYKGDSKCNLYIRFDSSNFKLEPGDRIIVFTDMQEIDGPVSPYQFDFKKYLYYQGIQLQVFAKLHDVRKLSAPNRNLKIGILKIRQFLVGKLNCPNINKRERAVASSLILGFTGNLDPELRNSYAIAGVMHILSVSGMHVGIVYCFLLYLLFFMNKTQKLKIVRSVLIILGIWFYALVTGFSPPVIRSAAMFSFFAAGQAINRNSNGFNTLAASAFVILLFNPFQITDMGFQLSYTAIAGIMIFYNPIYNAWSPVHWFADKIWALISVSLAAQIGTLPLTLFYFHKFPTYFIPTNLLIVPLSGGIIYAGLILLIFSFWSLAVSLISIIFNYLLTILNWLVIHVECLPGASIQGIYLNIPETLVLATMILVAAVWIKNKVNILLIVFLASILCFAALKTTRFITNEKQKTLIVHNTKGYIALSLIHNHEWLLLADSGIISKVEKASGNMLLAYNITRKHTLALENIEKDTFVCNAIIHLFAEKNLFVYYNGTRIVLLRDKKIHHFTCLKKQSVDFLILNEKSRISKENALHYFYPSKIITGFGFKNKINSEFEERKKIEIPLFFVNEQGAYKTDL